MIVIVSKMFFFKILFNLIFYILKTMAKFQIEKAFGETNFQKFSGPLFIWGYSILTSASIPPPPNRQFIAGSDSALTEKSDPLLSLSCSDSTYTGNAGLDKEYCCPMATVLRSSKMSVTEKEKLIVNSSIAGLLS